MLRDVPREVLELRIAQDSRALAPLVSPTLERALSLQLLQAQLGLLVLGRPLASP